MSRSGLRRALLVVLTVLLVTVGARALRSAASDHLVIERAEHGESVSVTIDVKPVSTQGATTLAQDVLFDESFSVREGGRLALNLGSENVTVRTVSGTRARVTVEGRGRDAASEFERRRFSARTSGGDLTVRTNPPRQRWSGRRDASFQVTIEIPRRYSADLDLGSGNVEVGSLTGDLRVDVGSGNVTVEDVNGDEVVLDTGSGTVRARALRGDVRIDTGSGSVHVDRVEGSLLVDTGSGSVNVGTVDGRTNVDTGSGSVEMTLVSAASSEVSTGSGSVTMRLPRAAGFDVQMGGGSVRIDDALRFSGDRERDEARGRLNGGGPTLRVSTGSGAIRLIAG